MIDAARISLPAVVGLPSDCFLVVFIICFNACKQRDATALRLSLTANRITESTECACAAGDTVGAEYIYQTSK
jgi:hypothetical protein